MKIKKGKEMSTPDASDKTIAVSLHPDALYVLLGWYDALRERQVPAPQDRSIQMLLADLLAEQQEAERGKRWNAIVQTPS